MKKGVSSQKRFKKAIERQAERQKWVWECVRRNKEFIEDFNKYGGKELDGDLGDAMLEKWSTDYLSNPQEPFQAVNPNYPAAYVPFCRTTLGDIFDLWSKYRNIRLFPAGTVLRKKGRVIKRFRKWTVLNSGVGTYEPLSQDNCPTSITITMACEPYSQKGELEVLLLKEFERAYRWVLAAQKEVFGRMRPRFNELKDYLTVYDLKKENRSWNDIAVQVIPEWAYKNPNKRGRKKMVASQEAIERVRRYYRRADDLINRGGWKKM